MDKKKENLTKLLQFVNLIIKDAENEWFKNELLLLLMGNTEEKINSDYTLLENIYSDLVRTKSYLKNIDRKSWLEGYNYYKTIKYPDLKLELIADYKEMKIAEKQDEIIEFVRRLVMQIENCLTSLIEVVDAHKLIEITPEKYQDKYNNLFRGKYSFFNENGDKKLVKDIHITSKIFFAKQLYDIYYIGKDFREMITIRNISSHRGDLSTSDLTLIENVKTNLSERKAAYFKCFDSINRNLKDLFE